MKKLFDETWKPIKGYEGLYEVSNLGNVRSVDKHLMCGKQYCLLKGKPKKAYYTPMGYLMTDLYKNGQGKKYYLHRLIAEAFIPNPNNLPCIDHINTVRDDNRLENLRWCTKKENANNPLTREHLTYRNTKPVYYIDEQGKKISFKSISEAARRIGCLQPILSRVLKENRPIYGIQFYFETEKATAN